MSLSRQIRGMDTDPTPVFYTSKKLTVSGMKICSGSSVYPVAAVTMVEVVGQPISMLGEAFLMFVGGFVLAFVAGLMRDFLTGTMSGLIVILGPLLSLAGLLFVVLYFLERRLCISLSSGQTMLVKGLNRKTAAEMRSAVERAMTYSSNAARGTASVSDELARLAQLKGQGAISEADWERAKDLFLGKQHDAQELAIEQLRQLHGLHKSGVLSESEFNMKKWDILSRRPTPTTY